MSQSILFDLEHHRKRLDYYVQQKMAAEAKLALNPAPVTASKKKGVTPAANPFDSWIEIYSDRVKKLENQAVRLGLLTREQLKAAKSSSHVIH